jgi:hypothetical protein
MEITIDYFDFSLFLFTLNSKSLTNCYKNKTKNSEKNQFSWKILRFLEVVRIYFDFFPEVLIILFPRYPSKNLLIPNSK